MKSIQKIKKVKRKMQNFLSKTKTKITSGVSTALLLGLSYTPPAFAATDPFATAGDQANKLSDKMKMFGLIFAGAFIIVLAVIYMFPFKAAQDWVKKHLGGVIIGVLGIGLGGAFITWLIQLSGN
ncbi:hypothetical protein VNN41_09955 [Lactococcus garvieae]|uniref:hypothetical protein n=1 Tax=Lactococcus garvieae TaxID=1363 RepID=UPI00325445C3